MRDNSISETELEDMKQAFIDRFTIDSSSFENTTVRLRWPLLRELMEEFIPGPNAGYACGLKFYFGVKENDELVLAISPLILIPVGADAQHVFEGHAHELYAGTVDMGLRPVENWRDWRGDGTGYIDRYYENVMVDRDDNGPDSLDELMDPCAAIVPWDEIVALYEQNRGSDQESGFSIEISHCSREFDGTEDDGLPGHRHTLAVHMVYNDVPRLGGQNQDPNNPYHDRAADNFFGCPVNCKKVSR
jgi:hypothetical protein